LSQSGALKLLVSNTLVLWRGTLLGLTNPHLQDFIAALAKSNRPRGRLSGAIGSSDSPRLDAGYRFKLANS
jgi:hypothetical protein